MSAKLSNKAAARSSSRTMGKLGLMILETFEPLLNALDKSASYSDSDETDTGHDKPSATDRGLQIVLDSMIRPLHRQLVEEIKLQDGRVIPSVRGRATKSASDLTEFARKYAENMDEATTDPQFYNLTKWYEINHAREDAYVQMYSALLEVYEHITGKRWVFVDLNQSRTPQTDKAKDGAKAILAMALANHKPEQKLITKSA